MAGNKSKKGCRFPIKDVFLAALYPWIWEFMKTESGDQFAPALPKMCGEQSPVPTLIG